MPPTVVVHAIPKDIKRGYIQSRNFTVQKQFGQGWIVQASYVGTLVVHQFSEIDLNAGQVIGAGVSGQPLNGAFRRTATTPEYAPSRHDQLQCAPDYSFPPLCAGISSWSELHVVEGDWQYELLSQSFPTVKISHISI